MKNLKALLLFIAFSPLSFADDSESLINRINEARAEISKLGHTLSKERAILDRAERNINTDVFNLSTSESQKVEDVKTAEDEIEEVKKRLTQLVSNVDSLTKDMEALKAKKSGEGDKEEEAKPLRRRDSESKPHSKDSKEETVDEGLKEDKTKDRDERKAKSKLKKDDVETEAVSKTKEKDDETSKIDEEPATNKANKDEADATESPIMETAEDEDADKSLEETAVEEPSIDESHQDESHQNEDEAEKAIKEADELADLGKE
ncbi:MAG: hypothetical protein LBM19_04345 [Holosporales bacterium]|nr:hypothetical protein [Holosporales bacterium]